MLRPDLLPEIARCDLSAADAERLAVCSAGFWLAHEFAHLWGIRYRPFSEPDGNALGITERDKGLLSPYKAATLLFNLRHCDDVQRDLGFVRDPMDRRWSAEGQIRTISATGQPAVFFVPPSLNSHAEAGDTRYEMEWYLANPDEAPLTHFVFGLYDEPITHWLTSCITAPITRVIYGSPS